MKQFKVDRSTVYQIIDREREYQERRWNEKTTDGGGVHSVTEFLVYMQDYLQEAMYVVSRNSEPDASENALDILRKVTALGVACMEQNGVVPRKYVNENSSSD